MTLVAGNRLGQYEIIGAIGAGGMGVVYRAEDTKLRREVAIKVLPDGFVDDDRMARFEREAHVLAALNHPNIAAIHGFEEHGDTRALVLEIVEGPTLADRLQAGPLPLEEALEYASQIAEGLEAAHAKGIIHRDLKPANIKITPDGRVKLLDFGLAKALDREGPQVDMSSSPTVTGTNTGVGTLLGTASYMSPEQARGQAVDKRSDIWAFGCVLFEMIAGKRLFAGDTISDTLVAVLRSDPEWDALPRDTPHEIRKLLARCLNKHRTERLQDIGDARIEIRDVLANPDATSGVVATASSWKGRMWPLVVAIVSSAALATAATWRLKPRAAELPVRAFHLVPERGFDIPAFASDVKLVISPDGTRVAFVRTGRLWVRNLSELEPHELPGTDDAHAPFWSPDGQSLAYVTSTELKRVSARGGTPVVIGKLPGRSLGGSWSHRGTIALGIETLGLFEIPAGGGEARRIAEPDRAKGELSLTHPHYLPDGESLLVRVRRVEGPFNTIGVHTPETRKHVLRVEGSEINWPVWCRSGHIVFQQEFPNRGIWAVPFSLATLSTTGEPFMIAAQGLQPSVSADQTLAFISGVRFTGEQLAWADRNGAVLGTFGQPHREMRTPAVSPDGKFVAIMGEDGGNRDVWIHDVARGTRLRLTVQPPMESEPSWSGSGRHVAFRSASIDSRADGILVGDADGSGNLRTLASGQLFEPSWSRDERVIAYVGTTPATRSDVWYIRMDGDPAPHRFLETSANERSPALSPNGGYLAYASDDSGREEVYVKPFPSGSGRWQVSVEGGSFPRWNRRGTELFYLQGSRLVATSFSAGPPVSVGTPRVLFSGEKVGIQLSAFNQRRFDVAPDGQRFVVIRPVFEGNANLTAIQNWPALLSKPRR